MSKVLVPDLILRKFSQGEFSGQMDGIVLVFDIRGFTRLTRGFMKQGRRGAEAISRIIQETISPSVEIVERAGAFVAGFAGDSCVAVFPRSGVGLEAAEVEDRLNWALGRLAGKITNMESRGGKSSLSLKVGVATGTVSWTIVQNPIQSVFFFYGEGMERAYRACNQCHPSVFCFDFPAGALLPEAAPGEIGSPLDGFFQVPFRVFAKLNTRFHGSLERPPEGTPDLQAAFVGTSVSELNSGGELRDVVVGLLSFHPDFQFTRYLPRLIDLVHRFGGHLNKIDWGDKGALALIIFGAPTALDQMPERAAAFFQTVIDDEGKQVRWGMALGTAFTGFVGSGTRCEYTALGDVVNLAARLMSHANWGEILVDSAIAKVLADRPMNPAGALELKGYDTPVEAFRLLPDSGGTFRPAVMRKFCGRGVEVERIASRVEDLALGKTGGVIYLAATAGMGKSALIGEVHRRYAKEDHRIHWLGLLCDQVLGKSFSPFKRCLADLMGLAQHDPPENNLRRLRSFIEGMKVGATGAADEGETVLIQAYLAHFMDLPDDSPELRFIDEKVRYENTLEAVKSLFLAMATHRPLVLVVEDFQWADPDSLSLLGRLCRWTGPVPVLIIATCRADSVATVPQLVVSGASTELVWLDPLPAEESAGFLEATMQSAGRPSAALTPGLAKFVHERGQGNPFYMEQILLYMLDHRLIQNAAKEGSEEYPVPPGINMLITARLDRLEHSLRRTVAAASVLGVEFHPVILSHICPEANLPGKLQRGEAEGLWNQGPLPDYVFSHGLIRDAAYNMQLSDSLRRTHLAAALAYESVFGGNPVPVLPELSNHFEKANEWKRAMFYLKMAGENALSEYQNAAAVAFFGRWLKLADQAGADPPLSGKDFNRIDALNRRGTALKNAGSWEEARQDFASAVELSTEAGDRPRQLLALINLGDIYRFRGAYPEAMDLRLKALKLAEELGDEVAMATIYGNMGNIHLCLNQLEEALSFYRRQESMARKSGNVRELSICVGNTGIVFSKRGDLTSAMSCYTEQLEICTSLNDIRGMAFAVGNIGLLLRRRGDVYPALGQFRKQLAFARQAGDKQLICNATGNLGIVALDCHDLGAAREHFEKQKALAEELGDRRTLAYAWGMLGATFAKMGELPQAKASFEKKLGISQEIEDQTGVASATKALKKLESSGPP